MNEFTQNKESYYKRSEVSHSDLDKFIRYGAAYYRDYKGGRIKTKETDAMDLGTKVHCYVMEPEVFRQRYAVVMDTPGPMMEKFINFLIANDPACCEDDSDRLYQEAYDYAGFNMSFKKVLSLYKSDSNQLYRNNLIAAKGKTLIDNKDLVVCKRLAENLSNHKAAAYWLGLDNIFDGTNTKTFTELEVYWEYLMDKPDELGILHTIACKSKLDKVVLDFDNKIATVVDFKTTAKPVRMFISNYREFKIYRQLAFYLKAIRYYLEHYMTPSIADWTFKAKIVAAETVEPYSVKVFNPLAIDLEMGAEECKRALNAMFTHQQSGVWEDSQDVENISLFAPEMLN